MAPVAFGHINGQIKRGEPKKDTYEPIAIIGLAFELPGGISSEDRFWDMLVRGEVHEPSIPENRFNSKAYASLSGRTGTIFTEGAHFLDRDIAAFDAPFFSISTAEAEAMDPLQRKLLETTYWALENAGVPLDLLRGSKTSVHVGCFTGDYHQMQSMDPDTTPVYHATGNSGAILANRISWFYDLRGPSMMIDTACSSSLVALDQACQLLRLGQTSMGIVGGCNIISTPASISTIGNLGFLSPSGRCYSFDERGNGYTRSEGFGVLILKKVKDAIRDGDVIRAVIRATATNQDGHTVGLSQPCVPAQESLLHSTYQQAFLSTKLTRFVEAHGTGTVVGDPIEATALSRAFAGVRDEKSPVFIGATKANLGHTEAASGITSIIKTILVLEKGIIPPIADLKTLNPSIQAPNLKFLTEAMPWPQTGIRRASVQSFGFGGTNAHTVLDDAFHFLRTRGLIGHHRTVVAHEQQIQKALNNTCCVPKLLIWSAPDRHALDRIVASYTKKLVHGLGKTDLDLATIGRTLGSRRTLFSTRAYAVVENVDQLEQLDSMIAKPRIAIAERKLTLIFTGQGAQWLGMGRELLHYPVFAGSLLKSQESLESVDCSWILMDAIRGGEKFDLTRAEISQTLCTALQLALVDLIKSFGLTIDCVIGHSSGEISAAYCTGAISAHFAILLAYVRGKLSDSLHSANTYFGAMMTVALSEQEVVSYLQSPDRSFSTSDVVIGCINSPRSVTLSGERGSITALQQIFQHDGIFARVLKVPVAYHSRQMEIVASEYESILSGIYSKADNVQDSGITMVSSVLAAKVLPEQLRTPKYWVKNLVSPVRFSAALACVLQDIGEGHPHSFLEIGPHSALQSPVREIIRDVAPEFDTCYHSLIVRHQPSIHSVQRAIGELHIAGHSLDISEINRTDFSNAAQINPAVELPRYPFDESKTYWHESRISKDFRFRRWAPHDLLGVQTADWNDLDSRWRNIIRIEKLPFIEDHRINDIIVYPAAAMIAAVLEGAQRLTEDRETLGYELEDVNMIKALILADASTEVEIELRMRRLETKSVAEATRPLYEFRLYSYCDGQWSQHCEGHVRVECKSDRTSFATHDPRLEVLQQTMSDFDRLSNEGLRTLTSTDLYEHLFPKFGYGYGPAFQGLTNIYSDERAEACASIRPLKQEVKERLHIRHPHIVHPAALDAALQLAFVAASRGGTTNIPTIVPNRIHKLWISNDGLGFPEVNEVRLHASASMNHRRKMEASVSVLCAETDKLLMHVGSFEGKCISSAATNDTKQDQLMLRPCFRMDWKPDIELMSTQQVLNWCWEKLELKASEEEVIDLQRTEFALLFHSILNVQKKLAQSEVVFAKPHIRQYVQWLHGQASAFLSGDYPEVQARYKMLEQNAGTLMRARERVQGSNFWRLPLAVADNLLELLTGKLDALQLLFGNNDATAFYNEATEYSRCGESIARYVELLAHKDPGLRILEVGAGTGSTTRCVLRGLHDRFSRYDFTDVSPSLVSTAQEEFGKHPGMYFSLLDIQHQAPHNFQAGSYDLVVAGSSLHTTRDLSETLRNVRTLLKPEGKLIVYENVKPKSLLIGFAFGLLPGWWLGVESYRQESPCIESSQWAAVLRSNGFSGVDVEFRDFIAEECHEASVLITSVRQEEQHPRSLSHNIDWPLILADLHDPHDRTMAESLRLALWNDLGLGSIVGSLEQTAAAVTPGTRCILLSLNHPPISLMRSETSFLAIQSLVKSASAILWVAGGGDQASMDPSHGLIHGLARTLRRENVNLRFVSFAIKPVESNANRHAHMVVEVFGKLLNAKDIGCYEPEYVEDNGVPHISRLVEYPDIAEHVIRNSSADISQRCRLGSEIPLKLDTDNDLGLSSMRFIEDQDADRPLEPDEIEIEVKAIGCNFRDSLSMLGLLEEDYVGFEVSGVVRRTGSSTSNKRPGDKVAALVLNSYRKFVITKQCLAVPVANGLSLIDAASIPINYSTAYRALVEIAGLQKGESILIHSAAGGTGQAALRLAIQIGATVYATAGSERKKNFLVDRYGLDPMSIMSSRDSRFRDSIRRLTQGAGVNVILNSLSGELLKASWECIAPYGRFIEIGKKDIQERSSLNMSMFSANTLFASVDIAAMIRECPANTGRLFNNAFNWAVDNGVVSDQIRTYGIDKLEDALRNLSSGESLGKIVIEMKEDAVVQASISPRTQKIFSERATYVIAGGLGGLGQSIARWMTTRGARNLLLLSRSTVEETHATSFVHDMKVKGVRIDTSCCDISSKETLRNILKSSKLPPIRGCIQAAMVLKDAVFEHMSYNDFNVPLQSKVDGSWNLHDLLPLDLDFFIMLSSAAGVLGGVGQANYAAGNTFQDALARFRVSQGLKATSIDLGIMLSHGYLANEPEMREKLEKRDGLHSIKPDTLLELLEYYCDAEISHTEDFQLVVGLGLPEDLRSRGLEEPWWMEQPLFRALRKTTGAHGTSQQKQKSDLPGSRGDGISLAFQNMENGPELKNLLLEELVARLNGVLPGTFPQEPEQRRARLKTPLHRLGVDSLIAVELRNWFARNMGADMTTFEILGGTNLDVLASLLIERSVLVKQDVSTH